jgi:hypothetical protein|tara:strand:+ start:587 stop:904 length:318 start_codon:yes stop_codon:yes gene_type:complete
MSTSGSQDSTIEEDLRLIANPQHLSNVKVVKKDNIKLDYNDILKNTLSIQYPTIYLSDVNLNHIKKLIDDYIKDINTNRIIDSLLSELIEKVVEENKFDFCLPFD